MTFMGHLLFFLGVVVGVLIIPFGLPGVAIIFVSALLYALATQFSAAMTPGFVVALGALMILAETADNWLMALGAKKFGASTAAVWLALLGGLLGAALIGPVLAIGLSILGPVVGAFLGAFLMVVVYEQRQKRNWREALRAGWGTLLGRVAGIMLKLMIGLAMAAVITWKVLTH